MAVKCCGRREVVEKFKKVVKIHSLADHPYEITIGYCAVTAEIPVTGVKSKESNG